ncbi:hypothetical protein [Myroides injenensis]|uniref:hypothetical protein n=1 Tax=Myroides injenensis TaxID=1183151 RepID=UPI0002881E27|nr:hypothetical protein [Myroides injenensis]
MKKYLIISTALLGVSFLGHAQVGIGTKKPIESAQLHIVAENKGVLLPKVALQSLNNFKPVNGDGGVSIGLVIFNTTINKTEKLSEGYYYWNGLRWNKLIDSVELSQLIPTLPETDPSGEGAGNGRFVIFNKKENKFYIAYKDENGKDVTEAIDMQPVVRSAESKTSISRRVDTKTIGSYVLSTTEPVLKEGAIVYKYSAEDDEDGNPVNYYINMSSDIYNAIENNKEVKEIINNTVNQYMSKGGNVYFGTIPGKEINGEVLYRKEVDDKGNETIKVIDIAESILNIFNDNSSKIVQEIKNQLGYNVTTAVVSTGNKFEGKQIMTFKGTVKINNLDAETGGVLIPGDYQTKIDKVYAIKLFDPKGNALNVATTDVDVVNGVIEFSLGSGNYYTTLPAGNYSAVIEFTANKE